jgi:hypothetical protein
MQRKQIVDKMLDEAMSYFERGSFDEGEPALFAAEKYSLEIYQDMSRDHVLLKELLSQYYLLKNNPNFEMASKYRVQLLDMEKKYPIDLHSTQILKHYFALSKIDPVNSGVNSGGSPSSREQSLKERNHEMKLLFLRLKETEFKLITSDVLETYQTLESMFKSTA